MEFLQNWVVPQQATATPLFYLTIASCALLIVSISKGGFGGGAGLVSVPLLLQVLPDPKFVIGLWLPVLISCDLATIKSYPKQWSPRAVWRLSPGMLLGIALMTIILNSLGAETGTRTADLQAAWLKFFVALVSITFAGHQFRPQSVDQAPPWNPSWAASLPIGAMAGVTTTLAHAAGPIVTMYLIPQKLDKQNFAGTCGRFYGIFNSIKVPFMLAIGVITLETLRYGLWMILLAPLGVLLGKWINTRISPTWFMRLIYACLVLAALKMFYEWGVTVFG